MWSYFNNILSKYQRGFRQDYTTQHCLLVMIKKWKEVLDKRGFGGALLAYSSQKHDLLIAKLKNNTFDSLSLFRYLFGKSHRTKLNNVHSNYLEAILAPLLFVIYICDILSECDIATYADDTTRYTYDADLNIAIGRSDFTDKPFNKNGLTKII